MVPGLPPPSGETPAAARGGDQHAVRTAGRSRRSRPPTGRGGSTSGRPAPDLLLGVSSMNPRKDLSPRLAALQERLGDARGKTYWRSLEELADSEAFQELMRDEFPEQAPLWDAS